MKKLKQFFTFCFLIIICTGCGIGYQNKVKTEGREFIERYPGNKITIQKAIKERKIICGMTMEEVVLSWGKPTKREEITLGEENYEKWIYEKRENGKLTDLDILYFKNGILVFWYE